MATIRLYSRVPIEPIPEMQIVTDLARINALKGRAAETLSGLCRLSGMSSRYIQTGLQSATFIFFLYESATAEYPVGFAIVHSGTDDLFIYAICTQKNTAGYGSILLRAVETVAKKTGKAKVQLEAEEDVHPFYEKNGYVNIGEVEFEPDNFTLEKKILGGRRKTRKGKGKKARKTRKTRHN